MSNTQTPETTIPSAASPAKLFELLVKTGILSESALQSIRERCGNDITLFEKIVLEEGLLTDEQLAQAKAQAFGWHFVDLDSVAVDEAALKRIPSGFLMKQNIVPYVLGERPGIALLHPDDQKLCRILRKKLGPSLCFSLATASNIAAALSRHDESFAASAQEYTASFDAAKKANKMNDLSAVHMVRSILIHAHHNRSSDIHIEPRKEMTYIRERTDGVLKTQLKIPKTMHDLIVTHIKVLGNLATDEHIKPQDGKIQFMTPEGKHVDVRVSISPTIDGEKIVLRLLAAQGQSIPLDQLGLHTADLAVISQEMERAWGMILVTGPTGSGKTTTLYGGIRKLHKDDVNIETIEDPVEYELPGVNQMQVNEKAEVNFATGLRSLVRQDPDIILVGEIRDHETASIAVNAAMTGHLVLSTLHTNDAATAMPRLMDMGIEPFLIASTINVVVSQRLVRSLCVRCKESVDVSVEELKAVIPAETLNSLAGRKSSVVLYKSKGCTVCNGTGFHGRTGIFEVLKMTKPIRDLIMQRADAEMIKAAAVKEGMRTMFDDGMEKVREGITTVEEVIRVTRT